MRLGRFLLALLVLPGLLAGPLLAEDHDDGLLPLVPKAIGAPHPEGNEFWRKNHMFLLQHDRDLTLREGDRTVPASLNGCLVCHAVTGPDAEPVPAGDPGGFCAVCHQYAAVRIDCFTCHRATPEREGLEVVLEARRIEAAGDTQAAAQMIDTYLAKLQRGYVGEPVEAEAEANQ